MSIDGQIKRTTAAARQAHGPDIRIVAARAKARGDRDTLLLVYGRNRAAVARDLAAGARGAKIEARAFYTSVQIA